MSSEYTLYEDDFGNELYVSTKLTNNGCKHSIILAGELSDLEQSQLKDIMGNLLDCIKNYE